MSQEYLVSRQYDWSDVSPTVGVVEALHDADGPDDANGPESAAVPALAESIDPDSLNELCRSASPRHPLVVSFIHGGYEIVVRSDGFVAVDTA